MWYCFFVMIPAYCLTMYPITTYCVFITVSTDATILRLKKFVMNRLFPVNIDITVFDENYRLCKFLWNVLLILISFHWIHIIHNFYVYTYCNSPIWINTWCDDNAYLHFNWLMDSSKVFTTLKRIWMAILQFCYKL